MSRPNREEIIWAYRAILGREPESEQVIKACEKLPSFEVLRSNLISSNEFANRHFRLLISGGSAVVVRHHTAEGFYMYLDLRDGAVSLPCIRGTYEPHETRFIKEHLKPGHGFIDAGANIGWFTLLAAKLVGKEGRVCSLEPRSEVFALLEHSLRDNRFEDRCHAFRAGLWSERTTMTLHWSKSGDNQGGATLDPTCSLESHNTESVDLLRLDDMQIDSEINMIKIDVEGAEYRALLGAESLIRNNRPLIISEILSNRMPSVSGASPTDYVNMLAGWGYLCHELGADGIGKQLSVEDLVAGPPVRNVLFVPQV
jgi:FkbM family methyltransferase